jgi:carboxylesterase type B
VTTVLPASFLGSSSKTVLRYLSNAINTAITCGTRDAARVRQAAKVKVWRYRYFGEWPNLFLAPGAGAYYGSETSMVFGTSEFFTGRNDTDEEREMSRVMRAAWSAFARDPEKGLAGMGWPTFDENGTFTPPLLPFHVLLIISSLVPFFHALPEPA